LDSVALPGSNAAPSSSGLAVASVHEALAPNQQRACLNRRHHQIRLDRPSPWDTAIIAAAFRESGMAGRRKKPPRSGPPQPVYRRSTRQHTAISTFVNSGGTDRVSGMQIGACQRRKGDRQSHRCCQLRTCRGPAPCSDGLVSKVGQLESSSARTGCSLSSFIVR
jgi:hypothetical protein